MTVPNSPEPADLLATIRRAIEGFVFDDDYSDDDADPRIKYAQWVSDLASAIVTALPSVGAPRPGCRCHSRSGLARDQHENDCPCTQGADREQQL